MDGMHLTFEALQYIWTWHYNVFELWPFGVSQNCFHILILGSLFNFKVSQLHSKNNYIDIHEGILRDHIWNWMEG